MSRKKQGFGLLQLPPDKRDDMFALGKVFPQFSIDQVPKSFTIGEPLKILNQDTGNEDDECTGFALTGGKSIKEGVILDPYFSFVAGKHIQGRPLDWGLDLRSILKGSQKIGAIPMDKSPRDLKKRPSGDWRFLDNWLKEDPELLKIAEEYKNQSFFKIDGHYDHFTNIRIALYQFREFKRTVIWGTLWNPRWPAQVPDEKPTSGFGHATYKIGAISEERDVTINSYSENSGDKGKFYFPRKLVNWSVSKYGAYMMVDMPPQIVKNLVKNKLIIKNNNMASTDIKSKFLELNIRDIGNSAGVVVLSTLFIALTNAMETGGLSVFANLDQLYDIFKVALSAGVAYLFKNLFENEKGENVGLGKVMNGFKK